MAAIESSGDSTGSFESEGLTPAYSISDMLAALDNHVEADVDGDDSVPPPVSYVNFPLPNDAAQTNGLSDSKASHVENVQSTDESLALMESAEVEIVDNALYATAGIVNGVKTKPKPEPRKHKPKKSSRRAAAKNSVLDDKSSEITHEQSVVPQPNVAVEANNNTKSTQQEVVLGADIETDAHNYELIGDQSGLLILSVNLI